MSGAGKGRVPGGGRQDDSQMLACGEKVSDERHKRTGRTWRNRNPGGGAGALRAGAGAVGTSRQCLKGRSTESAKTRSRPSGVCPGERAPSTGARGSAVPDSPGLHRGRRATNPAGSTQEARAQTYTGCGTDAPDSTRTPQTRRRKSPDAKATRDSLGRHPEQANAERQTVDGGSQAWGFEGDGDNAGAEGPPRHAISFSGAKTTP